MQTITPVHHLHVHCREEQHSEYMEFKHTFENFFRKMEKQIQSSEQNGITLHCIKLDSDKYLSYCIADKELYLGIYSRSTETLRRDCEFDELKNLPSGAYPLIEYRIDNMLRNQNKNIPYDKKLENTWTNEIDKIKNGSFIKDCNKALEECQQLKQISHPSRSYAEFQKNVLDKTR